MVVHDTNKTKPDNGTSDYVDVTAVGNGNARWQCRAVRHAVRGRRCWNGTDPGSCVLPHPAHDDQLIDGVRVDRPRATHAIHRDPVVQPTNERDVVVGEHYVATSSDELPRNLGKFALVLDAEAGRGEAREVGGL